MHDVMMQYSNQNYMYIEEKTLIVESAMYVQDILLDSPYTGPFVYEVCLIICELNANLDLKYWIPINSEIREITKIRISAYLSK